MTFRLSLPLAVAFWAALALPSLAPAQPPGASRWQAEFDRFAQLDEQRGLQRGGVVFVGSSSIRMWDGLEAEFDRFPVIVKRGFGGSTMTDCADHVERLVLAYEPRLVVVYAGENDLAAGATPDDVVAGVRRFIETLRGRQPTTGIAYISIKPSPLRAALLPSIRETNARIRDYLRNVPDSEFIDVHSAMLDERGAPRGELFGADRLHLNAAGYALWRREINARLP